MSTDIPRTQHSQGSVSALGVPARFPRDRDVNMKIFFIFISGILTTFQPVSIFSIGSNGFQGCLALSIGLVGWNWVAPGYNLRKQSEQVDDKNYH